MSLRHNPKLLSRKLTQAFRVMMPSLFVLAFASVAHAQGTMDFSGAQTLMGTFKTFAVYAGAVICFGGLIFAGIRMMSGRFQDAIPGLFGALFGAGVLGWGAGWIGQCCAVRLRLSRLANADGWLCAQEVGGWGDGLRSRYLAAAPSRSSSNGGIGTLSNVRRPGWTGRTPRSQKGTAAYPVAAAKRA